MKKVLIIIVIILLVTLIVLGVVYYSKNQEKVESYFIENEKNNMVENNKDMSTKMNAIVVKVNEKSLMVIEKDNTRSLLSISFSDEGNIGYKEGQEVLIYYDGTILSSYPGQIYNVEKIEIIKEKSDIEIPDSILRYFYSSRDKVNVEVSNLTCNGITLKITDTNELQYEYSHSYKIRKEVKNENYTGSGYYVGEKTENSTSAYIRTWI